MSCGTDAGRGRRENRQRVDERFRLEPVTFSDFCLNGIDERIGGSVGRPSRGRWAPAEQPPPTVSPVPPLPRVTGRDVLRALRRMGWVVVAQRGSHTQLRHPSRGGRVTVPIHAGETIGPGLLRSILAQAGITADEFRAAL